MKLNNVENRTENERQLRATLALIDYFARVVFPSTTRPAMPPRLRTLRKCLEGHATPAETLEAIRGVAAPFITSITDDQVLLIEGELQAPEEKKR